MLIPLPVPSLSVPTLAHGSYMLTGDTPQHFSVVVFYRGLHCPALQKAVHQLVYEAEGP